MIGFVLFHFNSCKKDDVNSKLTDADGNVYHTVTIGSQVWMVENLKTTKYRDGTAIPNIINNTDWLSLSTGAYRDYNNTSSVSTIYGKLYNWYAVADSRNLCPSGWHVPSDADWTILTTYLGGESVAGGKLKEIDTTHWKSPNTGATNETGFTALPGGQFSLFSGTFDGIGSYTAWWSSIESYPDLVWFRGLHYNSKIVTLSYSIKKTGLSVRCLKD